MLPDCGNIYKYIDTCSVHNGMQFWSVKRVLTYGRAWNFITGPRSCGKTTGTAIFLLLDALENSRPFLYLRRTKDECDLTKNEFFTDASRIVSEKTPYKIDYVECSSGRFFAHIKGMDEPIVIGYAYHLSKEEKLKSGGMHIYNVVYDEFISQDSSAYLGTLQAPKEYTKMIELYATLDREIGTPYRNEVRVFFLGNTATIYNPIFTELDMVKYIQDTSKIIAPRGKQWLLQQLSIEDVRALDDYKSSILYSLSTDDQINYNFNNRGRDDDTTFVEKKPDGAKPIISLALDKKRYGVYIQNSMMYVSKAFSSGTSTYALDVQSHDGIIDKEYIHTYGSNSYIKTMLQAYKEGRLRFDNARIKHDFLSHFRFLPEY